MKRESILIIDDDLAMLKTLKDIFVAEGFNVVDVSDAEKAMEIIYTIPPHIIILDLVLPGMDGFELCRKIRGDIILNHIPIIIITGERKGVDDRIRGLKEGAIDYIVKPFEPDELVAKIKTFLRHTYYEIDVNPLTRLPGNSSSLSAIESAIKVKEPFSVCYVDLDNFKEFNDTYGFNAGDRVIRFTANIIKKVFRDSGINNGFIGHIGGDDFIFLVSPADAEKICKNLIEVFDKRITSFYSKPDIENGYILQINRQGAPQKFPIMTISIAVVHNKNRKIKYIGQVSKIAAELKHYVKTLKGSNYVFDRRVDEKKLKRDISLQISDKKKKISELKKLIKNNKLKIAFLPIVKLKDKKVVGYESLLRGGKGIDIKDPNLLFYIAEGGNIVSELDRLCLVNSLNSTKYVANEQLFFINIRPHTLLDIKTLKAAIDKIRVKQKVFIGIIVDIPVGELFSIENNLEAGIEYIRSLGFKIAIDDVGSGTMSLRDIALIRPDFIKIDISLIRNINNDFQKQNIIDSLLTFAKYSGITIIAEGIETEQEREYLMEKNIVYGQGYLFSRPIDKLPLIRKRIHKRLKKTVLIIDDDPDGIRVLTDILSEHGYSVTNAFSGENGLEMAYRDRPDIVLIDTILPGIDGYEVCNRIKKTSKSKTKVIIYTASIAAVDARKARHAGADDYIVKTSDISDVIMSINEIA